MGKSLVSCFFLRHIVLAKATGIEVVMCVWYRICRATPSSCLLNAVRTIYCQVIHTGSCQAVTLPVYLTSCGTN